MKSFIIIFIYSISLLCPALANDSINVKSKADSAYMNEKFHDAIKLYDRIEHKETSPEVCYNLGCCYYRLDNMAKSILWFERALLLSPGDKDVRSNLELARTKTIDKIIPQHEFILFSAFRSVVNMMSLQAWTYTSILLFVLFLVAVGVFFFSNTILMRKSAFFLSFVMLLMSVVGNVCANQQKNFALNRNKGIVMSPAVTVKSTPSESGNDLFVIHEGTRVEITDNSLKEWCEVKIADGKIGWIQKKTFEII